MISFVTFHVDINKNFIEDDTPLDSSNFYNYQLAIDLMFRSAAYFHPQCHKIILSDLNTNLSYLPSDLEVNRYDLDVNQIMYSRLLAQCKFLQNYDFQTDIILLDSDIIISSNLEDIFVDRDFDIGLTFRDDPEMPINGGVIYISKNNKESVLSFFQKLLEIYQEKHHSKAQWWGDQHALVDLVCDDRSISFDSSHYLNVNGVKIALFDCDIYNFSPDYNSDLEVYEKQNKKIIHFKGPRKKFMKDYWHYHFDKTDNTKLKNIISLFLEDRNILEQKFLDLQKDRSKLKTKFKEVKTERDRIINDKKEILTTIQNQQDNLKKIITEKSEIEQTINLLQTEKAELNNKLQALERENQQAKKNCNLLQAEKAELNNKLQALERENQQAKNNCNLLQAEKVKLNNKLQALEQENQKLKSSFSLLQIEKDELKNKLESQQNQLAILQHQITSLQKENEWMKTSKFWQIREKYFKIKQYFGFGK
jgi:predicted nuclease with TOPRIM domain